MSEVRRGDLWLINFDPTIGHEIQKARPGVIIQNDIGNKYSSLTIVAPVTSQHTEKVYPIEVFLDQQQGLPKNSKVLLNQIRAVDKQRLIKKLGRLSHERISDVNQALKISLGLVEID